MANKKFLEEYPLYKKFFDLSGVYNWTEVQSLPKPAIHMFCYVCNSDQTFNMTNQYHEVDGLLHEKILYKTVRAKYVCSACSRGVRVFLIHFGEMTRNHINPETKEKEESEDLYVVKVGQYPAWSIEMDKELEKILGEHSEHSEYYRRGLVCESQGYGIGAYAYFRRITENIIDELLESILDLVEEDEKEQYREKLKQVKKEKIAEKKINLVKDLLPKSLQVDGMNPLKELYRVLSQGIHDETDEECMEKSEVIRGILVFLVNQVIRTKKDKKSFTEGMKKILGK